MSLIFKASGLVKKIFNTLYLFLKSHQAWTHSCRTTIEIKRNHCRENYCFTGLTLTQAKLKYSSWQDLLWHLSLFVSNMAWILQHLLSTKVDKSKKGIKTWTLFDLPTRHPAERAVICKRDILPVMLQGLQRCTIQVSLYCFWQRY